MTDAPLEPPPVHARIEVLHGEGAAVDDPKVVEAVGEHLSIVSLTWTPDPDQYRALGRMYVEDERFRKSIGRGNDAMVEYLAEAIAHYSSEVMGH